MHSLGPFVNLFLKPLATVFVATLCYNMHMLNKKGNTMYYLALLIQVIDIYEEDYMDYCKCTNCWNYDLWEIYKTVSDSNCR